MQVKAVIQTVHNATVSVDNNIVGSIDDGMLIYYGVAKDDDEKDVIPFFEKILKMRIFKDENNRMNLNLKSYGGSILLISQFTLETNIYAGNRPSLDSAAPGSKAKIFYEKAIDYLISQGYKVSTGEFGAHMMVSYVNDGPETFVLESRDLFK